MPEKCIVLHSGGQDSTTCLLIAIDQFGKENVYPVAFSYNQRHSVELEQARLICEELGVADHREVFSLGVLSELAGGALTNENMVAATIEGHQGLSYHERHNLPSTVVPGRNVLFLTVAAAWGANMDIYNLMTGGCLADYDGYPDCRPEFYRSMEETLSYALDELNVDIITPLTHLSKADTFELADKLGGLDIIIRLSHTCYEGVRHEFEWGAGCGGCPACLTRQKGWEEFKSRNVAA